MTIRLMNTKTRKVEEFVPLDPANVRMYVCGPTVYDRAHLGNARPVVVFDVLYRLLRHVYGESHVTYVRNFTDVDDKINAAALARQQAGDPRSLEALIRERTEETIRWYHADMDALGALRPSVEPRATEWIGAMIAMTERLIAGGHAYVAEGHVLFAVESYAAYGALSGRSVEDMIAGARVEVAPFKRNPMDFVLWKPSDAETPGWDSPWGRGRPGWHIECSAMARELLGETFDIHGGGIDLQFPHHENEIAQSACAHPEGGFARYWLHNEMLQVEGKKMSKSLGNFFTVRDLLDQGVPGEVIRFVMLGTHYRKPMDWTEKKRAEAEATLRKWRRLVEGIEAAPKPNQEVANVLSDDLNTAGVIALLHQYAEALRNLRNASVHGSLNDLNLPDWMIAENESRESMLLRLKREFRASAQLLGLLDDRLGEWLTTEEDTPDDDFVAKVQVWLDLRAKAKATKNYKEADRIRKALSDIGIMISDSPEGTTWLLDHSNNNLARWELIE
jgi:cysteinyl-tRNA synthetase